MPHTLDENRLDVVFEALKENAHKLSTWEVDRLEEWEPMWERRGKKPGIFSDKQLECLERMYQKV